MDLSNAFLPVYEGVFETKFENEILQLGLYLTPRIFIIFAVIWCENTQRVYRLAIHYV